MGNNMRYSRGHMMTRMPGGCSSCATPRMVNGCDSCGSQRMANSCDDCGTSRSMNNSDDCRKTRDELRGMPLAMAYVPWQEFGCTYEPMQGLHAGTIFPELDKPFSFYGRRGMR